MRCTIDTGEGIGPMRALLTPDLSRTHPRSRVALTSARGKAIITIDADDPVALRATLASITGTLSAHHRMREIVHG